MTPQMEQICKMIRKLSNSDILALQFATEQEISFRGLNLKTTYDWNLYQHLRRVERQKKNGFNEELAAWRRRNGLTQIEAAKVLGIGSSSTMCNYESGATTTPRWVMELIRKGETNGTLQRTE